MPAAETFGLFAFAAIGVLLIPGPAVTYIVARSVDQGRTVGLVSVAGLGLGTMAHVVAAALGVSAVLASSAAAFSAVKYLGAAYLIAIGIRTLLRRANDEDVPHGAPTGPAAGATDGPLRREAATGSAPAPLRSRDLRRAFAHGVVVNVLNPKTALFFLAFLPQFADPGRGPVWAQLLALGSAFVLLGLCTDGAYALVASRLGEWLRTRPSFARRRRYATGGVFVTLGLAAALGGPAKTRPSMGVVASGS